MLALASFGAACGKSNDLVAQEQINQSRNACPKGCEVPPPGCEIKGNISAAGNKIYHRPGGADYDGIKIQTEKGERWFCNEDEAIRNGFRLTVNER